jgi:hypothetical protein
MPDDLGGTFDFAVEAKPDPRAQAWRFPIFSARPATNLAERTDMATKATSLKDNSVLEVAIIIAFWRFTPCSNLSDI